MFLAFRNFSNLQKIMAVLCLFDLESDNLRFLALPAQIASWQGLPILLVESLMFKNLLLQNLQKDK